MDKSLRTFIRLSLVLFVLTVLSALLFYGLYAVNLNLNLILLIGFIVLMILGLIFLSAFILFYLTYTRKQVQPFFVLPAQWALRLIFPFMMALTRVFKLNKDGIRNFYVNMNNILVKSRKLIYKKEDILILLPHCLQNANCGIKITHDMNHCKTCGQCVIGAIKEVLGERGLDAYVVTGGTVARKLINENRPKIVLSVACERDLVSGIEDVGKIQVIGVLNERPYGPCYNTVVDMEKFKKEIDEILNRLD